MPEGKTYDIQRNIYCTSISFRHFDKEGADLVLLSLQEFLERNTTFKIETTNIGIISGFEEGASGWIAVNYLNNKLKQVQVSNCKCTCIYSQKTVEVTDKKAASQ